MTLFTIKEDSISNQIPLGDLDRRQLFPLTGANESLVAILQKDIHSRYIPVLCENMNDVRQILEWGRHIFSSDISWRKCAVDSATANKVRAVSISSLF